MMARTLGVELAHRLAAHGVRDVFGIPGVHNVELYRGLNEAGLTHVLARHEQGVGFMADGYARATGKPGVGLVISGPGLTNIMTPMGQAYSDRVPMLIISSCLDDADARQGQLHQMIDQRVAAQTVCAWSLQANSAADALRLVDRAFAEFAAGLARTVHIQVPIKVLSATIESRDTPALPAAQNVMVNDVPADILEQVVRAKRPIFIFGAGAAHAAELARDALNHSGGAAFTTYSGRGIIPAGTPSLLGATLARPSSADVLARADIVVAVGTELAEVDLWRQDLGHDCPLIRVDLDPKSLSDGQKHQIAIHSDAAVFLEALVQAYQATGAGEFMAWPTAEIAAKRKAWRAEIAAERPGLVPVIDALQSAMPEAALIYSDMTQLAYSGKEIWDMPRPASWHHPCGFGTLGYAVPAAIGAAAAQIAREHPRPVVAIAGDYGFQYTLQELGTARELACPLPIILWDNGKLKEIEDCMVNAQITPNAVMAFNPDFSAMAQAYDLGYCAPSRLGDIQNALHTALAADRPTLIHLTPDIAS